MSRQNIPGVLYSAVMVVAAAENQVRTDGAQPLGVLADYQPSLKEVLGHEGGYTNDPQDPGGPTNWGITLHDAQMYWRVDASAADVRAMPLSVAKDIYKAKYWDAVRGDELPTGLDYCVFDYGVNSGVHRAIPVLQRMLGVADDGVFGADTMKAVLAATDTPAKSKALIDAYQNERLLFLKGLKTWDRFGKGWAKRVQDVRTSALLMAGGMTNIQVPAPVTKLPRPVQPPLTPAGPAKPVPPQPATGFMGVLAAIFRVLFGTNKK